MTQDQELAASSDEALLAMLDSPDEQTRANAAAALARRGHPQAMDACLRTIADAPEPTHAYSTPAGWQLIQMGLRALPHVIALLLRDSYHMRLCAEFVTMQITKRQFGFDGQAWSAPGYEVWANWWEETGYRHDAPASEREAAAARLMTQAIEWVHP